MIGRDSRYLVHLPFGLVMLVTLIGFVRVSMQHWREGAMLLGGALVLAAVLRATLPVERVSLLAIRSRVVDIVLCSGLGLLIIWVATIHGLFTP